MIRNNQVKKRRPRCNSSKAFTFERHRSMRISRMFLGHMACTLCWIAGWTMPIPYRVLGSSRQMGRGGTRAAWERGLDIQSNLWDHAQGTGWYVTSASSEKSRGDSFRDEAVWRDRKEGAAGKSQCVSDSYHCHFYPFDYAFVSGWNTSSLMIITKGRQ